MPDDLSGHLAELLRRNEQSLLRARTGDPDLELVELPMHGREARLACEDRIVPRAVARYR